MARLGKDRPAVSPAMLIAFTAITSFAAYSVDEFLPGFPAAGRELGVAASTVQLTITAFLLGIATGQLFFGPLSDRFGRRTPLLIGAAVCVVAAVAAALSPTPDLLIASRVVQGFTAAAGLVMSKTVLRDRSNGDDMVLHLSTISVVAGFANIFAPIIGGFLAGSAGWRATLWFLVVVSALILLAVIVGVPETHPIERRSNAGGFGLGATFGHLRNGRFVRYLIVQAGSYGALIAYVSASPFIYQNALGVSAGVYGLLFAVNGTSLVVANLVANRFLRHIGSRRLVLFSLALSGTGALAFATSWLVHAPTPVVAVFITLAVAPLGLNTPNLVGLALDQVGTSTGSAAATIGFFQFAVGAVVAPLVGITGIPTPLSAMDIMVALTVMALVVLPKTPVRTREDDNEHPAAEGGLPAG